MKCPKKSLIRVLLRVTCGGTSKETVLRSVIVIVSMQGTMKNRLGPTACLSLTRPTLNITALSYSCQIEVSWGLILEVSLVLLDLKHYKGKAFMIFYVLSI